MRRAVSVVLVSGMIGVPILGCWGCWQSQQAYQGAGVGGAGGALAGALVDKKNPWRGGVIGGLLGAAVTGTAVELSSRAAREAAQADRPVTYESEDRAQRIEAQPVQPQSSGGQCQEVRTKYYEHGEMVREEIKNVCP